MSDKRKLNLILPVLIGSLSLLSLYLIFFGSTPPSSREEPKPKIVAAQDFGLLSLRGDYVKLSDYRGKVVFLNIWATWCPPCRDEMPSMESLYQRLKGRKFELLAVSIDQKGEKVVRPFVARFGLSFPVLLDPDSKTYRLFGLTGVPESFLVDKNGIVIHKIVGPQDWMRKEWLDYFDRITG